jgi:hypothetical protein
MADVELSTREFGPVDGRRAAVLFGLMAAVGAAYWFLLPVVQSMIIPTAPGGDGGPWVLRPSTPARFGAMAVLASVTAAYLDRPLRRLWAKQDAALGSRYDPFRGRPGRRGRLILQTVPLLLLYAAALVFYLGSWTTIHMGGIDERLPWALRHHAFRDVASLETIPDGERSDSLREAGPWYAIHLRTGRTLTLNLQNEGTTHEELAAIAAFVADRTGLRWERRADARYR